MRFALVLLVFVLSSFVQQDPLTVDGWVKGQPIDVAKLPQTVKGKILDDKLYLVLLGKKSMVVTKGGSKYLVCYLVNNTAKSVNLRRADGKLSGLVCETLDQGKWTTWGSPAPIFCGNSYWSQSLEKGKALLIHVNYNPAGLVKVPLRMAYSNFSEKIVSNQVMTEK